MCVFDIWFKRGIHVFHISLSHAYAYTMSEIRVLKYSIRCHTDQVKSQIEKKTFFRA